MVVIRGGGQRPAGDGSAFDPGIFGPVVPPKAVWPLDYACEASPVFICPAPVLVRDFFLAVATTGGEKQLATDAMNNFGKHI